MGLDTMYRQETFFHVSFIVSLGTTAYLFMPMRVSTKLFKYNHQMHCFSKDLSIVRLFFADDRFILLTVLSREKWSQKCGPNLAIAINKGLFTISKKEGSHSCFNVFENEIKEEIFYCSGEQLLCRHCCFCCKLSITLKIYIISTPLVVNWLC